MFITGLLIGLLGIVLANILLAIMPLPGGRDNWFPRN